MKTMKDKIIQFLEGQKILILGYGREGQSAHQFLIDHTKNTIVGVADLQEVTPLVEVPTYFGPEYLEAVKDYDIVIKSPGIIIKDLLEDREKEKITSLTDLFLRFCDNPIIGITGTKGKSTTASLIHHILTSVGQDNLLIGNIGRPCFEVLDEIHPETIIVYELSSHQLEFVKQSPKIAILLNIYEEHLDHYLSMDDYVQCKKNIYRYQTKEDYLIYGDVKKYLSPEEISQIPSTTIDLNHNDLGIDPDQIKTKLIGDHNKKNIMTALLATRLVGVEPTKALETIENFTALPHRLEYVGKFKDIDFYNDSIATAQEAVICAIESLKNVNTIIIGGMDRGIDYTILIQYLNQSDIENIILLPDTNVRINALLNHEKSTKHIVMVHDLEEAVQQSFECTKKNTTCLLSPAAASYGFYRNFEERGDHFKKLVKTYGTKK